MNMNTVIDSKKEKITKILVLAKHNNWYGFAVLYKYYGNIKHPVNGYSINQLKSKTEPELDQILSSFKKYINDAKEQAEKSLYYNKPDHDAEFDYWCKQPYWNVLDEGVILILGKEPRKIKYDYIKRYSSGSKFEKKYTEIRETAQRYITTGELSSSALPGVFLAWAQRMGYEIPVKLLETMNIYNIQIADWQTLYKQAAEIIAFKNKTIEILEDKLNKLQVENEQLTDNFRLLLDEDNEFYSLELDAANIIQNMVIKHFDKSVSFKEQATQCLDKLYPNLSSEAKKRIAIMLNPNACKLGGRPKEENNL
jgi:hypothetical protein